MKTLDAKRIEELKLNYLKSQYIRKSWAVDKNDDLTLEEYANYIDPVYKHVIGNPEIIIKKNKKGLPFLKVSIPLEGGGEAEYDLSYNKEDNDFEEGDFLDKDSLLFRTEKYLEKTHSYVTGRLAE